MSKLSGFVKNCLDKMLSGLKKSFFAGFVSEVWRCGWHGKSAVQIMEMRFESNLGCRGKVAGEQSARDVGVLGVLADNQREFSV